MSAPLVVDDVEHRLDGARLSLRRGDERSLLTLDPLGDAAVEAALAVVRAELARGATLAEAASAATGTGEVPGRCARIRTPDDVIVLDDTAATTADEVRRSLKVLADATRGVTRSFAVVGELVSEPASWFDDHDQLGRLAVRLDVSQLIVVGHGARHTATAAGLEGSWSGESILVDDPDAAYDELRARLRPGDAVLVTAAGVTSLAPLLARLTEETA